MVLPVEVVQRQLEAYNARDLSRFIANFSDSIQVFRPPAMEPAISGKERFSEFYATQRFNRPGLKAEVMNRMVLGNKVIDHERIVGVSAKPFDLVVVYAIADDLIQTIWAFDTA
jgi:hypothetical protein